MAEGSHLLDGISALVLAGGRSQRMGRSKALLPFGGGPLILHVVCALGELFPEVVVVAAPAQRLPPMPARIVRDSIADQGPARGICEGLRSLRTDAAFVTSCDAPFLNASLVRYLASRLQGADVVVPRWGGRDQPLHAIYRTSLWRALAEQLARHEMRPAFLFERVLTCRVHEEEIAPLDPEGASFWNINTPQDYERALARLGRFTGDSQPAAAGQCRQPRTPAPRPASRASAAP